MDEDFFSAVAGLERGQALLTSAHAVIKKYGGEFICIKVGCDEPIVYELDSVRRVVEWMERWGVQLWPSVAEITLQIPMDMNEIDFVIRKLLEPWNRDAVKG